MFQKFSDSARRAVVGAQEEARLLNHNYLGTEHLLLAILYDDESTAARALHSFGITSQVARAAVVEIVGRGGLAPSGHLPFTPRAKTALEESLREALQLGDDTIGTEHLLLALLREGTGVATRVIVQSGASLDAVGDRVLEMRGHPRDPKVAVARGRRSERVPAPPLLRGRPVARCSLCGRSEEKADHLLVAGGVMLCDRCVRDAAAQLDALDEDAPKRMRFRRRDVAVTDKDAAMRAIERAFEAVIGPQRVAPGDALWAVEGGAEMQTLLHQLDEDSRHAPVVVNDVTVERVRFLDDDEAEVSLGIWMAGSGAPMIQPAHAVVVDGTWKVSRETLEYYASQARQFRRPPI
jgi:Clp amino terminal domain, pathogenicity island component/ClpX C4-type zinc finger